MDIIKTLISKCIQVIVVIFGATFIVSLSLNWIPGDPVSTILGEQANTIDREELRKHLGLDLPWHTQYYHFIIDFFSGSLTDFYGKPVLEQINARYPNTLILAFVSMSWALLFSLIMGVQSAVHSKKFLDRIVMTFAILGISFPRFWLGPVLIIIFSIKLNLLPIGGSGHGLLGMILPTITLGFALSALLSRVTRASMLDVMNEDYIRTARAKGLSEFRVIYKHALKNALIPIITIIGLQFGSLLGGTIVTEKVFDWPGLGLLLLSSIQQDNYRLTQGIILVLSLSYVLVNLITDILYMIVDPRISIEKRHQ